MKKITSKITKLIIVLSLIFILVNITSISASELDNTTLSENNAILASNVNQQESLNSNDEIIPITVNPQDDLKEIIANSKDNDIIVLENGTYKLHNVNLTRNITLQGNGNPRDIIIDGENKFSIFLIRSPTVHATFNNITFINGRTDDFGGVISIETGNAYVDNCIFINNTALRDTNAGAISNYGNENYKSYLLVNNSLFINNHADHDGGAVTTCYASSDIYNCVFINNSAHRDGGAIRVSVQGYGNVEDCIFMYNHADEWGGAYYSWAGTSNIKRCIFLNNTAGTNGGAVMVSGNLNLEKSIIVNNTGDRTGGSFYIQQPMFDAPTKINVHDNLITNNTSPYGQEIFIKWNDINNLYTYLNNNDWGDENPNDSSVIDPDNVTERSAVKSTIKSDLLDTLDFGLLNKYEDLIGHYFPSGYLDNIKKPKENIDINNPIENPKNSDMANINKQVNNNVTRPNANTNDSSKEGQNIYFNNVASGNSTSHGEDNKAYELNKKNSVSKKASPQFEYFIALAVVAFLALAIGYKRGSKE